MNRTLSLYNPATGEFGTVVDISSKNEHEVFTVKFDMMCNADDPWIVVDSAEDDELSSLAESAGAIPNEALPFANHRRLASATATMVTRNPGTLATGHVAPRRK